MWLSHGLREEVALPGLLGLLEQAVVHHPGAPHTASRQGENAHPREHSWMPFTWTHVATLLPLRLWQARGSASNGDFASEGLVA